MPDSRPADYYIGYLDGCVFMDFSTSDDKTLRLERISFDGYGCCNIGDKAISLNIQDANTFRSIVQDTIKDQVLLEIIIKRAISLNVEHIWTDALQHYKLI